MGLNRIYKVVWNKTKGCYVVVSELAKRVGRNKAKAIVISSAAMAMAVSPMMADAAPAGNTVGEGHANAVALGPDSNAPQDGAVALGKKAKAKAASSVALGEEAIADQPRSIAIGKSATITNGQDTIAIGTSTNVQGNTSIVIGKNAKITNNAEGTVVIGRDAFSEGSGNGGRPNTVVGRGAYTGFGEKGTYRSNASTALGFQAGSGLRTDPTNGNKLVNNETNADSNENVLVKAGYGLQDIKDASQKVEMDKTKAFLQAGFAHNGLDKSGDSGKSTDIAKTLNFYRQNHINEGTALGVEARAIGDQSIAIGGQVVAGDGVVALGGNDTDALRGNKYQVVTDDAVNKTNVNAIDDYNLAYTESTRTVADQYNKLVGRAMPTGYRSTYGQSGSVVIGMEAHSTTALGTAIGTNSVVRMGAFGATAIGAGSTVQPNAEAAVAIGMGSVANGAYALAGGTASWAEYGDIALGYQAKASGKDGAIAMGRATNAQGDSSIMIGGANIASAAAQSTSFEKGNGTVTKKTVTEKINGQDVRREYTFAGTNRMNGTVAEAYKELTGIAMETAALDFVKNKNGHASTSLGVHALSKGDLSTAIGAGSRSEAIGSVALGVGAHATRQNAVAIGTGSTTDLVGTRQLSVSYDKDGNVVDDNSPNKAYTFNWAGGTNTAEGDVVSFGSSGSERQLKNVAAGRVAEDSTDAINGSQLNAISKKLATGWNIAGDPKTKVAGIGTEDQVNFVNGNGTTVTVTKQEEVKNGNTVTTAKGANVKFDVNAADGSITSDANGISVNTDGDTIGKTTDGKLKANTGTINTGDDGKAAPKTGDGNKLATVDTVVNAVNNAAWKATAGSVDSGTETGKSEEKIKAGDVVTFKAGDNLAIKQDGKNFIYSLKPELTGLTSAGFKNAAGDTTVIDGNGMTITPKDASAKPVSLTKDGLDNGGKTIKNVTSGLTNYDPGTPKAGLVDLSKPATGTPVPDTTAATVGDLRNMGWVVSSDKTTGELTKAYTDQVKNADEVKFVGEGGVTVSGKTENGVRTITVKAEAQEMPDQPVSYTTADGTKVYPKTVTKPDGTKEVKYYSEPNGKGSEILKENVIASINGPEGTKAPTTLSNVAGNLDGAKKDTKAPTTEHAPVNSTDTAAPNYVNPNNAATVGDVLNAGWNLQNNGTAKDFVKPYDTVNFVNGANTTAVVTTNADGTTSNVTYNVTGLPVTYTDAEGNPVAKVGDKYYKVNNQGQPVDADGNPSTKVNDKGQPLDAQGNVIDPVDTTKPLKTALVNPTPEADKTSTTSPTSLNNVKNNIPTVNDADKKAYDVNGAPIDGKKNTAAPITAKEAADLLNPTKDGQPNPNFVGNNAATVSDVLSAGWNLQNNGEARDFVKPYDTVNFVNGANTTAVVTTAADGTTSDVTYNVTGLPVTFTDKDGKPVSKIGDKYYPVNEKGQPITPDGKPAVKTNEEGKPVAEDGTVIEPIDTKANPLQSNLVNPNVANTTEKTNNQTTSPTQLGNVANGANTFEPVDGKKMANDGKWYPADQVEPNGQPKENVQPVAKPDNVGKAGLIDFSKSNPNNAATVGDLQNLGWIVSAEGNKYSDQVRNANEVKFVGEGTATVTGKTDDKGVRTITVKVDDQASTNNAQTPVVYTDKDGKKVYPIKGDDGTVTYHTTPDGKGDNDEVVPNNNVVTSINGPEGTTSPTELKNVKNNIPAVNDADKKVTNPDGTEKGTAGDVNNINKAPLTAAEAADLLKPTKDGQPNPNFVGNNAATVSDVLSAGWNLQNNGEARDFVKPYDTVNFVNGANTTAVVTTAADGTTSDVTYNVTGLPVTFTDKDGKPVSKIGDKYYPVNEKGQPVTPDGKPAVTTNAEGKPVTEDGTVIEPIDTKANPLQSNLVNPNVENTKEKPNNQTTSPTQLGNVANGANTFDPVEDKKLGNDGKWYNAADVLPNGQPKENVQPVAKPDTVGKAGLIDFSNSNPNNAATVGDLQNLGWIVSAEGNNYSDQVRNANEVKFVGEGTATVTGKTDDKGVRTITVKVDDQVSTNNAVTPVVYTDKDGNKVYPIKGDDGTVTYHTTPDGKGDNDQVVPNNNVVTSINGPEGTTSPTELKNVKNNIPAVNDADKKVTNPDGTEKGTAGDVNNINKAPLTATEAADLLNPTKDGKPNPKFAGNNAATVSDVLNAGWNLQNNGTAKDFVKPYDTVNFVDGANTTAVVTTNEDGTTSNVTYNVTGLPVTFTDKDGKPVSKIGDKYYPVNEKGQPVTPDGKPAVTTNAEGKPVTEDGTVIEPINTDENPLQTNLVNPNVANSKEAPNNQTTSPTQLGNVANGANTFAPVDGKKMANDGKWYPADQVEPNGQPKTGAAPVDVPANIGKAGLIDFSKSNPNNAATVGDLQNLGWIVSAEGNNYSDQVRNANEVKFVGEGTASVTGKTDENGVRTITVKVDDQVSTNNAQTPVNYTNKDGKKVYPVKDENGNVTYHTTPDGKGAGDETVPAGDVITSLNGPEGTTAPTTLNNVKNNIPAVNDADKKVTNPDGTEKGTAGDVNNINKAPLTAAEAADLLKPTKDGKPNPNFAGNNAATVSDVLNAGWNLQNNGEARDFVKPFDTVNFVNGGNTTAVVTTAADGTTSDVTFNVTGLPITYTTADGKPVSKVGDKYYPVNEKGQPIGPNGKPAVKTAPNGDLLDEAGNVIQPIDTAKDPLKSNMVNPNVANTADAPNNQTTTPTQLGNVANGAETFKPADDVKLANDGKWYPADQVEPNGKPKKDATPVASPLVAKNKAGDVLEKGNDGNWYKASDLEKGEPKPNAEEQFPEEKPENADKAGLINFENSNPNNAATVGDLQNMGFVVSAKDNGYTEQMRNANKVEFKGDNGVQVTGKTLADGTREITVALKEGRVTNNVIITDADGKEVKAVRGEDGKIYKKDPKTGKAMKEEFPIKPTDTVRNDGDGYVTGNSVATAIQKSGWNIGIGSTDKAFSEEAKTYERVNPKDNVKYVNGANTTVSMVVDAAEDKDGATVTTTYVKVDVNRDLHIDSVTTGGPAKDKAGNPLKQVNGEYYPENALVNDGKVYPAGTVMIDGKPYPAGSAKDPKTKTVLKDGKPAPEAQPLRATPKDQLADGKDGAMTVKDAKGNDGVSATAKDGKGTLTLKDAGKDGKDASQVDISTAKAPADLENTPKDAVRANDGNWYAPADVTVEVKDGKTVVTPKAGKTPIPNAPTMDRIQYTGTDGKPRNVATMDDGLRFVGDDGQTISKPLNSTMEFTGGNRENGKPVAKADTTTGNIGVFHDNGKLSIQLAKDLEKMSSANFENPDGTSTKITGNGLSITPETAKLKDPKTGKPILDKDGNPKVDATKVVSFGAPTVVTDPKTGKPMVDPATGKPVMKSGISAGGQVMSNVAQGVADTDAVNVSQLKGVANNINMRMNRMGAQAAAMGALRHLQYDPLEPTTIMAGVGAYKGEAALALGIAHYKNESTLFHAGASIGSRGDELMANAGVSWKFGSRADETAVKDTFRQGPISSSYTLQDKVSALEAQNQVQKDEINNLKAQLAEVLQYVKKG